MDNIELAIQDLEERVNEAKGDVIELQERVAKGESKWVADISFIKGKIAAFCTAIELLKCYQIG